MNPLFFTSKQINVAFNLENYEKTDPMNKPKINPNRLKDVKK